MNVGRPTTKREFSSVPPKLAAFLDALTEVERIVSACGAVGVVLVNPRQLLVYRKRLEPFTAGPFNGRKVYRLGGALDAMRHPELLVEDLKAARIKGPGVKAIEQLGDAFDALRDAQQRAEEHLEEGDYQ